MTPAQQALFNLDVKILLEQWGRWSRATGMSQSLREGTMDNEHWFSDEHGLLIDGLMSKLRVSDHNRFCRHGGRKSFRYKVVRRYYLESTGVPVIAKAMGIGETKVLSILNRGEEAISAYIDSWSDAIHHDSRAA